MCMLRYLQIEHSYSAAFLTNDCINVVYAGTLDSRKGGATAGVFYLKIILFMCLDLEVKRKLTIYVQS